MSKVAYFSLGSRPNLGIARMFDDGCHYGHAYLNLETGEWIESPSVVDRIEMGDPQTQEISLAEAETIVSIRCPGLEVEWLPVNGEIHGK